MVKLKKLWLLASLVIILMQPCLTYGALVPHLYDATLQAESQSEEEWLLLVQQGLTQVLERAGGDMNVAKHPQVKRALDSAADYVEQYSYEGKTLTVKYSADLVNQLVEKMGQSVWGQRRPNVVLWLAIEDNHQRRLVGAETDPSLHTFLTQFAKQKGIPLILPSMDLEDMSAVTVTDVWGQFPTVLQQASERYGAQTILLGRVTHEEGIGINGWEGNWQLLARGDVPPWKVQGQSLEEVLSKGIIGSTHYLKGREAPGHQTQQAQATPGKPFLIGIEGIRSSADFADIEKYLKSLDQVIDVNIHQLLGQVAVFEITPRSQRDQQSLEQAIAMETHLLPSINSAHAIPGLTSVYRWDAKAPLANPIPVDMAGQEMNLPPDPTPSSSSSLLWEAQEGEED